MAWRPNEQLIEGELDNTVRGKVTGWMRFVGVKGKVNVDLEGDFHSDIAGCRIRFANPDAGGDLEYMKDFNTTQKGEAGDITAGLPPQPYVSYPYIEWYAEDNGRVVLELDPGQIKIVEGPAWTPESSEDLDTEKKTASQAQFADFVNDLNKAAGCPVVVVGPAPKRRRRRKPPVSLN